MPAAPSVADAARLPGYLAHADIPLTTRTTPAPPSAPATSPVVGPGDAANVAPSPPAQPDEGSPLDRTLFLGADYPAPSPVSPTAGHAQPQRAPQPVPPQPQRPSRPAPGFRHPRR